MGVYKTKQYILIRKDLNMPAGKLGAQAAHASVAAWNASSFYLDKASEKDTLSMKWNGDAKEWFDDSFAKVCLAVKNEAELEKYYKIAQENNLPCSYIIDNGTTVFNGVKTPTCVGVGPAKSEVLEPLFKKLQLYK